MKNKTFSYHILHILFILFHLLMMFLFLFENYRSDLLSLLPLFFNLSPLVNHVSFSLIKHSFIENHLIVTINITVIGAMVLWR